MTSGNGVVGHHASDQFEIDKPFPPSAMSNQLGADWADNRPASSAIMPWSNRGRSSAVVSAGSQTAGRLARGEERPDSADALTPRHYETALSLLENAAKALQLLYERRDHLEASLEAVSAQAEQAVMAAQTRLNDWQHLAASLKSDALDLERRLAAMQQRAELAEVRLDAERARADAAERQASVALGLSHGLHSRIISAFGMGSNAHKALLVAVDQSGAE
jgi:hypothetical protein